MRNLNYISVKVDIEGAIPQWVAPFITPKTRQFRALKKIQTADNQRFEFSFGRDYWTRTSDLAPPRRVRYQLR